MDIKKRTISEHQSPWEFGLIEVTEEPDGQVLEKNTLMREARSRTKERRQSW
jgi:hypothetical protein